MAELNNRVHLLVQQRQALERIAKDLDAAGNQEGTARQRARIAPLDGEIADLQRQAKAMSPLLLAP